MAARSCTKKEQHDWALKAAQLITSRGQRLSHMTIRRALAEIGAPFTSMQPLDLQGITPATLLREILEGYRAPAPVLAPAEVTGTSDDPDGVAVWNRLLTHHRESMNAAAEPKVLSFPEDKPLVILAMGDAHIGSPATDYERLAWVQHQARQKHCYLVHVGDFLDEMILPWAHHELAEQRSSIREQVAAASVWLAGCGDRMLAMIAGNHDLWAASRTGMAHVEHALAAAGVKPLYSRSELRIIFEVGPKKLRYEVVIRHKVQGKSMYRAAHGVDRWHLFHEKDTDADVVIAGHTHSSGVSRRRIRGKMRHGVQLGAYKKHALDGYAIVEGFADENESPDMVLTFHANRHHVEVDEDSARALERRRGR